jgi:hypothetical protein
MAIEDVKNYGVKEVDFNTNVERKKMNLNKAEKIQLLKNRYRKEGYEKNELENDEQFIHRITNQEVESLKEKILKRKILMEYSITNPLGEIDVQDLLDE